MSRRLLTPALMMLALLILAVPSFADVCGSATTTTLYAGRTTDAGTVRVYNDSSTLYVEFSTTGGWQLTESHVAIATSLAGIPQTKSGNPKVSQSETSLRSWLRRSAIEGPLRSGDGVARGTAHSGVG